MEWFLFALLILAIAVVMSRNVVIVPQATEYIVERLGAYYATWETGLHFKTPFIDRVAKRVSMKEQVVDFKPQPVITRDNVTIQIDTVVFFQITDTKMYTYGIDRPISAIENLSATTLRNMIGELDLEQTLTSRDIINSKITTSLDLATDKWGIKVLRVELKNIIPPSEIQDAMERQMKADREKRESILRAEGEKQSKILVSEGNKEAEILRAEAEKEAAILRAEAEKEAALLRAEAVKQQKIREAEGEAQAIMMVQQALADSVRVMNEAHPTEQVLTLKSLEALQKVADGRATKLFIPSNLQGIATLAATFKEVAATDTPKNNQ